MPFDLIVIIIIVSYLRKSFQTRAAMPEWNKRFTWILYGAIFLIAVHFSFSRFNGMRALVQWLSIALLSYLIYIVYSNEKFKSASFLVTAVLPYLVVDIFMAFIKLVDIKLFDQWHQWLEPTETFAIIWGLGTWVVTNRQRKELNKARQKTLEQEQNNKVITAMKANLEVQVAERTSELTKQKEELEGALKELKSTQKQLIQSEKMASLGELTAGIAHEIQNPLNFVNNFSEVSNELIEELKTEISKSKNERDEGLETEILNDISQNLEKINHHGKRADAIVKGMLQHSRSSSGILEPTDINALADEYLRLSFHGLRAKDKTFNADFKTDFDETTGKINIIPQDIGRVLLNLFNNAFYAVNERLRQTQPDIHYEPIVSVTTKKSGNQVIITVSDNGNGIPQKVVDKIFQPFFTTKPTGEGTGLGLSISYDIIKAHGGEIRVESKEGEGTKFIIKLPIQL
ncbi:MAG: ATP-binding protein [Ginsengibacter sp.]